MATRPFSIARGLGLLLALAVLLPAVALPASATAQTRGPTDIDDAVPELQEYLKEVQEKAPIVHDLCKTLPEGVNRGDPAAKAVRVCEITSDACAKGDLKACGPMIKLCERNAQCDLLLPPKPGGPRFQFNANWAKWLTSYFHAGDSSDSPRSLYSLKTGLQAAGFGLLAVFMTFGIVHYWASGMLSLGNGMDLLSAPLRAVGAGFGILIWPRVLEEATRVLYSGINFLLGLNQEQIGTTLAVLDGLRDTESAFEPLIPGPNIPGIGVSDIISLLVSLAVSFVMLALTASKIALDFSGVLLALIMPLALAMWALPGMSWLASNVVRASIAILLIPFGWALTLAVFAPIAGTMVDYTRGGIFVQSMAQPMVAVVILLMLFAVMRQILHWGKLVPGGSRPLGAAWSAVLGGAFMGMQLAGTGVRAFGAARRAMPNFGWSGGQRKTPSTGTPTLANALTPYTGPRGGGGGGSSRVWATAERMDRGPQLEPPANSVPKGSSDAPENRKPERSSNQWKPPEKGAMRLDGEPATMAKKDGTPSIWAKAENMEMQASRHRLSENGAPDAATVHEARHALPFEEQRSLRILGDERASKGRYPESTLSHLAAQPTLDATHREAYRTLLDAAHHSDSRAVFRNVVSQPPTRPNPKSS